MSSNDVTPGAVVARDVLVISAILLRRRRLFLVVLAMTLMAGAAWALLRPSLYRAKAEVIPSSLIMDGQQQSLASTLRGFSSRLGIDLGQAGGNAARMFPAIVASRDFFDGLNVRHYARAGAGEATLAEILRAKGPDQARRDEAAFAAFRKNALKLGYDEVSGITTIAVVLPDPVAAKSLAEAVVEGLGQRLVELKQGENQQWLGFLEDRFARTRLELAAAEDSLSTFLSDNRSLSSPMLQMRESALRRELQVRQEVVLTVQAQLESARLESGKSLSGIAVLERPTVPVNPMGPARTLSMLLVAVLATLSAVLAVAIAEVWHGYKAWRACQPGLQ